jgi:SAP domain-containing new25
MKPRRLSPSMTLAQFDNGYWYAVELKSFARGLGFASANDLRKDELERAIRTFLKSGAIESPPRRLDSKPVIRDVDRGLRPGLRIVGYINDATTKEFLERQAHALDPYGRYVNFVSDFLASEAHATHARAVKVWHSLKSMNIPKTYRDWSRAAKRRRR